MKTIYLREFETHLGRKKEELEKMIESKNLEEIKTKIREFEDIIDKYLLFEEIGYEEIIKKLKMIYRFVELIYGLIYEDDKKNQKISEYCKRTVRMLNELLDNPI